MAKTVISPCMGVGKIVANVTRRAAYQVQGQCPEDVELLSLPALLAGDAHERALLKDHPSIVIDGCALRCGAHIFRLFGVEPAAKVELSQIMKEQRIGPGKTRKELEETGKRLSAFTAQRVLEALREEVVTSGHEPPRALAQEPPPPGAGCAYRGLAESGTIGALQEVLNAPSGEKDPAGAEAALAERTGGEEPLAPKGERTAGGKHRVTALTILPCQGIKRSGGRVTQRAAYEIVEDRYLGRSQVLCISALAAGVGEDVEMLEQFPTVALNGCPLNCASAAAEHHGVPAVAHVNLHELDRDYPCEAQSLDPELSEAETRAASKLAAAVAAEMDQLLDKEIPWRPGRANLHGLVHEPMQINQRSGFSDPGRGFLVALAKARRLPPAASSAQAAPGSKPPTETAARRSAPSGKKALPLADSQKDYPGLPNVLSNLFRPKSKTELKGTGA